MATGSDVNPFENPSIRDFFIEHIVKTRYTYNFSALGRPIIQLPQDMIALQELIWVIKPDLIIETGIAHGGSLVMSAAMLTLLEYCEAAEQSKCLDPTAPRRKVLGIDVDIRAPNRIEIEKHPMASRISMIEGSSTDECVVDQVIAFAKGFDRILVCLDSNHTHDHVMAELNAYSPLVSVGSYCVVLDTAIDDVPGELFPDREWGPGNNPKTAVHEFIRSTTDFVVDHDIDSRLVISVGPQGYLKRVK